MITHRPPLPDLQYNVPFPTNVLEPPLLRKARTQQLPLRRIPRSCNVSCKPRSNNNACKASADPAGYSPAAAPAPRAGKREGRRGTGVPMPPTVPGDRPSGKEDLPPPLITSTASDRGSSALHFRARRNNTSRSKSSRSCKRKRMCEWNEGTGCLGGQG